MPRPLILSALTWLALAVPSSGEDSTTVVTTARLSPEAVRARGLGGTELEHVARRLARELATEARPAPFEGRDGSAIYLLGPDGEDGQLLLSGLRMGHVFEPAEVPGHGGELLRIPQLVAGVRHLAPGLEPRCGVAVLEMQLDPKTGVPHASGLRALTWADLDDFPQACGVVRQLDVGVEPQDALVFEAIVIDRREDSEQPPAYREQVTRRMVPGGFTVAGEAVRERLDQAPKHLPLLIECEGVDECSVQVPAEDAEIGSELVRAITAQLPDVRVVETSHGWGWTRVQLEGPRDQVDKFLAALQEGQQAESLSAELVVRSGELARATVRFRAEQ